MGKCGCCQPWRLLLCKCLCEEMSMCKAVHESSTAESVTEQVRMAHHECLRWKGATCLPLQVCWDLVCQHGDGWNSPLHHMAALARAATPWTGSCGCKWVIICWLIVLCFRNPFKVTWLRWSTWVQDSEAQGWLDSAGMALCPGEWPSLAIPTSSYRLLTALQLIIFFFFFNHVIEQSLNPNT